MMIALAIALLVLGICLYFKWACSYWRRNGNIDGPQPLPIVGNGFEQITGRKHFGEILEEIYRSYPSASWVGIYELFNKPAVLVRDLDLVRDILVSDFGSFSKNNFMVDERIDPLAAMNPFVQSGDKWKERRSQIVTALTAGKVRGTFPIVKSIAENLLEYVDARRKTCQDFEAKEMCARYTIDSVISCAFGIDAASLKEPDAEFVRVIWQMFNASSVLSFARAALAQFAPKLASLLKLSFVPQHVDHWFRGLMKEVILQRNNGQSKRQDLFQAIYDNLSHSGDISTGSNQLIGHAVTFLTEGFETSSTLMSHVLFELASNQHIQDRVLEELDHQLEECDGQLTDETIQKLSYMDRVIFETLRLHSVVLTMAKICTKEYTLPPQYPTDRRRARITPGMTAIISVHGIHLDPEIFPDPFRFEPDRFLEESKQTRHRYAFLGFGEGPRICLGMKFGMHQSKIGLATLLRKYRVELSAKQQLPLEISKQSWLLAPRNGIWVRFVER